MPKLRTLAKVVRSKNAGPFMITIDVQFPTNKAYERVKNSRLITVETISRLYKLPKEKVYGVYFVDGALAIKASIWKLHPAGDPRCTSVLGTEFHVPLAELNIP